ncbi:hypothetical protein ADK93_20935 [Streptomyces sp. XY58]|nr:hypothetical protein ADK93_20935 [Streptomyces sp. XY58]KOV09343.1 hypothetical protein ADK89_07160 [Streptomyces sp. XY37]KOV51274.1 hypothetical protein ADK99_08760 [Streptomyces sp. MMG1064]
MRRRRSLEERIAEHRWLEQREIRQLHEYVERCDGDVRRTLIRLSTEIGDKDPVAKSQDMMIRLSLALDGQVSGEQLEAVGWAAVRRPGRRRRARLLRRAAAGGSAVPDQDEGSG